MEHVQAVLAAAESHYHSLKWTLNSALPPEARAFIGPHEWVVPLVALVLVVLLLRFLFGSKELPVPRVTKPPPELLPKLAAPGEAEKDKFYTREQIDAIVKRVRSPNPPREIECFDPSTYQKLGTVTAMTPDEVAEKIKLARKAQATWKKTSFKERRRVLRMLMAYIIEHQQTICEASCRDSGKSMVDAYLGEILTTCEKIRHLCDYGEGYLKDEYRPSGLLPVKLCKVEYHPIGVVGLIEPWNYPFHNIYGQVVAAIYAGNGAVVKVSEWTSWSGPYYIAFARNALEAAGHDPDLVQLVTGYGDAGQAVVQRGSDKIVFTGSPGVGRRVMEAASKTLTPVVLELGGKVRRPAPPTPSRARDEHQDPMIVCEDADLDAAIRACVRGCFTNCGQNCINIERVYVHEAVHDRFVQGVLAYIKNIRQGAPLLGDFDLGAMTMPGQIELIEELVKDAVARGAKLLSGGKRRVHEHFAGQFFEPTLLTEITHEMRIVNEEAFGPVMLISKFSSDDEVIRRANATEYGLGSTVYSCDYGRANRIAEQLVAGMTVINDYGVNYLTQALPFGGVKISGFGKFNGPEGLRGVCYQKAVVTDRCRLIRTKIPDALLFPMPSGAPAMLNAAVKLVYRGGLLNRLSNLASFAKRALSLKTPKKVA
eukprot:tig00000663_g2968.t1